MKTKIMNSLFNKINHRSHPGRYVIYSIIFFLSVFLSSAFCVREAPLRNLKVKAGIFLFLLVACLISFLSVSNIFAQTTANFNYSSTYGGLTQYHTPVNNYPVDITRNGFGGHPVKMVYDNTTNSIKTTYNFQDNAAGRRVVQELETKNDGTITKPVTSHFLFGGGLRPKVEFRDNGTAHFTIYGPGGQVVSYITSDSSGNTTRLTPIHDRLGSTRALVDSSSSGGSGDVEARFGYNTMGKPTETDACTDNSCDQYREYPYRFQGHRYIPFEDETATTGYTVGVTDNVDRLYSHDHGLRFMNTDVAHASVSPYTAYGNDPVNLVDRNGLFPFKTVGKFAFGTAVVSFALYYASSAYAAYGNDSVNMDGLNGNINFKEFRGNNSISIKEIPAGSFYISESMNNSTKNLLKEIVNTVRKRIPWSVNIAEENAKIIKYRNSCNVKSDLWRLNMQRKYEDYVRSSIGSMYSGLKKSIVEAKISRLKLAIQFNKIDKDGETRSGNCGELTRDAILEFIERSPDIPFAYMTVFKESKAYHSFILIGNGARNL